MKNIYHQAEEDKNNKVNTTSDNISVVKTTFNLEREPIIGS